jgi:hypothetical protein
LIPLGDIYQSLEESAAAVKVLLVDACRNDPLSSVGKSRRIVKLETLSNPPRRELPGGIAALFSCSRGEQSFEDTKFKHGIFFHFVILGLSGKADFDKDKLVSLAELEQYTVKEVQSHARLTLGTSQTPERRGEARGLISLAKLGPVRIASPPVEIKPREFISASTSKPGPPRASANAPPLVPAPQPQPEPLVELTLANNLRTKMKVVVTDERTGESSELALAGAGSRAVKLKGDGTYNAQVYLEAPPQVFVIGQTRAANFQPLGWFQIYPAKWAGQTIDVDKMSRAFQSSPGSSPNAPNNSRRAR